MPKKSNSTPKISRGLSPILSPVNHIAVKYNRIAKPVSEEKKPNAPKKCIGFDIYLIKK